MNKKFSTLVAALLVSGVSYAVVGAFNAPALTNSPIAQAASANLRASSLTPTQSVIKAGELVAGDFNASAIVTTQVFKVKEVVSGSNVLTVNDDKAFLSADGSLSDDFSAVGTSSLVALSSGNYVTVGGTTKYLILSKDGITVRTAASDNAAKASLALGEELVKAYNLTNSQPAASLTTGTSYLLGGELAPKIPSALKLNIELEDVPTKFEYTAVGSAGDDPGADAKFKIETNSAGDLVLRLKEGEAQFAKVVKGELTVVDKIDDASVIALDGSDNVCFDGTEAVNQLKNPTGGANIKAYTTHNGAAAVTSGALAAGDIYLVDNSAGANLSVGQKIGTFLHFSLKDPKSITLANEAPTKNLYSFDGELRFAPSSQVLKYTAKTGYSYELKYADENAGTEITYEKTGGSDFKIGTNHELQTSSSGKYVTLKNGKLVLADAAATDGTQIYVWGIAANAMPALTTNGTTFVAATILSTSNTGVGTTIAVGVSYLKYDLSQVLMQLTDGAYYYLEDNTGANCLIPSEKAGATADDPAVPVLGNQVKSTIKDNDLAGLWKATAYKNENGVVTHYSFKYRADETKNLAFDVKYNRTTSAWEVTYNPEGKYTRFVVDKKGFISFTADETATVKGTTYTNKKQYALFFTAATVTPAADAFWSIAEYDKTAEQLSIVKGEDIIITGDEAAKQVEWLNVTAGNGVGFGVFYVGSDSKKVTLEDNVMVKNQITAVQGPNLKDIDAALEDLSSKVFLKISGDYEYQKPWSNATTAQKKSLAEEQLAAFRDAKFVVVDTVLYSAIIDDAKPYYYLTDAKGSDMISAKGYHANQATSYADLIKTDGNFVGLKRRLENAEFEVHHPKGSVYTDPVYFSIPNAMMPVDEYNEKGLINSSVVGGNDGYTRFAKTDGTVAPMYLAVKQYNNKYYLGAAEGYSYLFISKNNDVDYTKVNGIVNIISRNYKTDGQPYANADFATDYTYLARLLPKYVCLDKPEGQFLVTGGDYNEYNEIQPFTFTNRESGNYYKNVALKSVTDENGKVRDNIYSWVGSNDTIEIKPVALTNKYVGYKNYSKKDLDNTEYVLKFVSKAGGVDDLYITENHDSDHSLGLDRDTIASATFKLVKFEGKNDTVFVSNKAYSYINDDKGYAADKKDTVATFTYAIYNADNKEFLTVNNYQGESTEDYFYCDPDNKYDGTNAGSALRFILKEKADGTIQLIPTYGEKFTSNNSYKLYAGLTDNKVYAETSIYKRTDNDLFKIVPVGAPMYRTIDAAPFDTVRIYKEGMENVALFAATADQKVVSGKHFLGMGHKADRTAPKYSFFVDTAYVNREDNYKPQYMLAIDADTIHGMVQCPIPSHGLEDTGRIDTVAGKFLVNMYDSIPAWGNKHDNPYYWEGTQYPRLGFVNAKHYGDSLVVIRDNGIQTAKDTLDLSKHDDLVSTFAFRIVDQSSKSFLMETTYKGKSTGWIKWLNGIPVVVSDINQAEVFNFEPTTNTPTANEEVSVSEVSVITGNGYITIKGAEGKTVVITNVLGQTIANTVISSDNATISAPAGVVVVAVEGEAAVKAIVK